MKQDLKLVEKLIQFLGYDGIGFFDMCMEDYGTYTPVLVACKTPKAVPHPVHLREGMAVRNFLRQADMETLDDGGIKVFTNSHLDDIYVGYIAKAVEVCHNRNKERENESK